MARPKRISFKGAVERHSEALSRIPQPADVTLVERGVPRSLAMRCPDGCGDVISVNLDPRTGPAWRLYKSGGKLTLYPSVDRPSGCKAHFIIWRNEILWCGPFETTRPWTEDDDLKRAVLKALPKAGSPHIHFEDIAARVDASPWEVMWTCYGLESEGKAISSKHRTHFGSAEEKRRWWQFW